MKKLLSFMATVAIVIGTFAFTNIGPTPYCILNDAQNDCRYVTASQGTGVTVFYVPNFTGDESACQALVKDDCDDSQIDLIIN